MGYTQTEVPALWQMAHFLTNETQKVKELQKRLDMIKHEKQCYAQRWRPTFSIAMQSSIGKTLRSSQAEGPHDR